MEKQQETMPQNVRPELPVSTLSENLENSRSKPPTKTSAQPPDLAEPLTPAMPPAIGPLAACEKPPPMDIGVLGKIDTLTETERMNYMTYETVVETGWQGFVDVGLALAQIRDQRLYREDYDTFQAYCRDRWAYGRRYVDQLISAAQVSTHLRAICSQSPPEHECQVRPLVGLTPDQCQAAWEEAVRRAQGHRITARLVKNVVKTLQTTATPPSTEPVQAKPPRGLSKKELRHSIDQCLGELLVLIGQGAPAPTLTEKVQTIYFQIQALFTKPRPCPSEKGTEALPQSSDCQGRPQDAGAPGGS